MFCFHLCLAVLCQVSVADFGAIPNDDIDDSAAFQAAVDASPMVTVPLGVWHLDHSVVVNQSTRFVGISGKLSAGRPCSRVIVRCQDPGIHRGTFVRSSKSGFTITDQIVGPLSQGTGVSICLADMVLESVHELGSVAQFYNCSGPMEIERCTIGGRFRGLLLSQCFNVTVRACAFSGSFTDLDLPADYVREHFALCLTGHGTVSECSFQACGCGVLACGPQITIAGGRVEMCGVGVWLSGRNYGLEHFGGGSAFIGNVDGVVMESNQFGLVADSSARVRSRTLTITSNLERGRVGLSLAKHANHAFDNLIVSGQYSRVAVRLDSQPVRNDGWTVGNSSASGLVYSRPLGDKGKSLALSSGHAAFSSPAVVDGGAGSLVAFRYASVIVDIDGLETTAGGPALATVAVPAGGRVRLAVYGSGHPAAAKRRFYKGTADGHWLGYWERPLSQSVFDDDGTPFDGRQYPIAD